MHQAKRKALFAIAIALFIVLGIKPSFAEEEFYYRVQKLEPQLATSALFLTPVRERQNNLITLDVVVDPAGEEINTIGTEITFPTDKLTLKTLGKENSFCSFFIEEQIDNQIGKIKISCSAPYPGINILRNVATLTFEEKKSGSAELKLSNDSVVLANDGYGTNVLKQINGQTIILE